MAEPENTDAGAAEVVDDSGAGGHTSNTVCGGVFFHAVFQGRDITVQLPPRITPALSGLPPASPVFRGREQEIEQLLGLLEPGGARAARVSAVAGLGGVGKTELVVQVARMALARQDWFPGGVLFVDLSGYDPERILSPERALDGLLRALGIPGEHIPPGLQDRSRLYRSVLAALEEEGRRVLVVLDNVARADQARPLLPNDDATAVLVTSRHTLPGLKGRQLDLRVLPEEDAVALLRATVSLADPDDPRSGSSNGSLERLAHLCGRLPLALHLAAGILIIDRELSVSEIITMLSDTRARLTHLDDGDRTVRATFDLSYRLLTPLQADLFRLFALNPGPDLGLVALLLLVNRPSEPVEKALRDLVQAHLLEHASQRWSMHDLLRDYASDLTSHVLAGDDSIAENYRQARARLLNYYDVLTGAADRHLDAVGSEPLSEATLSLLADRQQAMAWLDAEHRNVLAAIAIAEAVGNPVQAVNLSLSIGRYLERRRYLNEMIDVSRRSCALAHSVGDLLAEGRSWQCLGIALKEARRHQEAVHALRTACTTFHEANEPLGEADSWNNLGLALQETRDFTGAQRAHLDALDLLKQLPQDRTDVLRAQAMVWSNRGNAFSLTRDFREAIAAHRLSTMLFARIQDQHSAARALCDLGAAMLAQGEHVEAVAVLGTALQLLQPFHDRRTEAGALSNLGSALKKQGRSQEAIACQRQAIEVFEQIGDRFNAARSALNLTSALMAANQLDEALTTCQDARAALLTLGEQYEAGTAAHLLGMLLAASQQMPQAIAALEEAVAALHQAHATPYEIGTAWHSLATVYGRAGNTVKSTTAWQSAADAFRLAGATTEATQAEHHATDEEGDSTSSRAG